MKVLVASVASVLVAVLIVVIGVGGYLGGWWLREDAVNRTAQINNDSYNRQNALVEQILDDITEAQDPSIVSGQRIAIVSQICDSAGKLTGAISLSFSTEQFISEEC